MTAEQNARPCSAMRGNSDSGTSFPRATPCRSEYMTRTVVMRGSSIRTRDVVCTSGCAIALSSLTGAGPEPVEQPAGVRRGLRRVLAPGFQQCGAVLDALGDEALAVLLGPAGDDLDRALGVELHPEVRAEPERLRALRVAGELGRPGRRVEAVPVPLQPRAGGDELRVVGLDLVPPELGRVERLDLATEHRGEQLAAEAQAEHRHVVLDGLLEARAA